MLLNQIWTSSAVQCSLFFFRSRYLRAVVRCSSESFCVSFAANFLISSGERWIEAPVFEVVEVVVVFGASMLVGDFFLLDSNFKRKVINERNLVHLNVLKDNANEHLKTNLKVRKWFGEQSTSKIVLNGEQNSWNRTKKSCLCFATIFFMKFALFDVNRWCWFWWCFSKSKLLRFKTNQWVTN